MSMKQLSFDDAITVGVRKYRELYPEGMIPKHLEDEGVLGAVPGDEDIEVHVTYWFEGASEPFYLFRASVNRESGDVSVTNAEDWHVLKNRTFDDSQSL